MGNSLSINETGSPGWSDIEATTVGVRVVRQDIHLDSFRILVLGFFLADRSIFTHSNPLNS